MSQDGAAQQKHGETVEEDALAGVTGGWSYPSDPPPIIIKGGDVSDPPPGSGGGGGLSSGIGE